MHPELEEAVSTNVERLRRELWAKRLDIEAHDESEATPGEGWARELLGWGLRMAGLYPRGVLNANSPVLRRLELRFDRLPEAFDGFRVLHVSDFHFDGRPGYVEGIQNLLDGVDADLGLLTGDFRFHCHGACDQAVRSMEAVLPSIRARHGVFAILGNHDSSTLVAPYEALGIRWLLNDNACIREGRDRIWLAGLDDNRYFRTHSIDAALYEVPADEFKILMAHSPQIFRDAARRGVDLCLCGHTHNGQIRLPVLGALARNDRAPRRFCFGHWQHGPTQGYTTAGIGATSLPIRFNCPPEAALLTLRRSDTVG